MFSEKKRISLPKREALGTVHSLSGRVPNGEGATPYGVLLRDQRLSARSVTSASCVHRRGSEFAGAFTPAGEHFWILLGEVCVWRLCFRLLGRKLFSRGIHFLEELGSTSDVGFE
jgi:hypothetical protein